MTRENIAVSLNPGELEVLEKTDIEAELKLDWKDIEQGGALGEDNFSDLLEERDFDQDQIVDVHLPPGTSKSNPGMSATRENLRTISAFSYSKFGDFPEIFFTTHPPKKFNYLDQLWTFNDLFQSIDERHISIENTSADSKWYNAEQIGFFGFCGEEYPAFKDLFLTIDSAHLPQGEYIEKEFDEFYQAEDEEVKSLLIDSETPNKSDFEIEYNNAADIVHEINNSLESTDEKFPRKYIEYLSSNIEDFMAENNLDGIVTNSNFDGDRYLPLLRTVAMNGDRIKSIHLNDPETNDVPTREDFRESEALRTTLEYLKGRDNYLIVEPEGYTSPSEALDYQNSIQEMMDKV